MNQRAHKCGHCKKAFQPTKIDQVFCSARCRQAAYRKRKLLTKRKRGKGEESPALVATCDYCGGSFWAKTKRSQFCSTSCRTLNHRAMRTALEMLMIEEFGLSPESASEIIETQPIAQLKKTLTSAGLSYLPDLRAWTRTR
jgi:predicted nucleic acid-binding Zn ribbon protein